MPSKPQPTFRVTDRTDRELLAVIHGINGDDGATAAEIAQALNISINGNKKMTPAKAIGPRLGSMRTVGLLDRRTEKMDDEGQPFKTNVWFVTASGKEILGGKLAKSLESSLGRMNPGQQLLVMQRVVRDGYGGGTRTTALTIRRQFQYEQAQRKVAFRH